VTLEDVCFIEAVRCRPKRAGPWHPSDIVRQRCRRFLVDELPILRPRFVLPLGTTATISCLEAVHARRAGALQDVAGTAIEWAAPWGQCWIVPLYHPSPANNGRWPENKRFLQRFVDDHPEVLGLRSP
jgi:uracil-DNA glycosylase family 4